MRWSDRTIVALLEQIRDNPTGKAGVTLNTNLGVGSVVDQEIIRILNQILGGTDVLNNYGRLINLWGERP